MKHIMAVGIGTVAMLVAVSASADDLHHDDFQSGEAGAKAGMAIYNNTIGKDNPLKTAPTWEEQARQKARDAGREMGERYNKPKSSQDAQSDSGRRQSDRESHTDNLRQP
jgi:hypothetical protein